MISSMTNLYTTFYHLVNMHSSPWKVYTIAQHANNGPFVKLITW